jgi:hypothetical protein
VPKRPRVTTRIRHNTRKWVLKALDTTEAAGGMLTKEIQRKVSALSGAKIPPYSVYQALRTLVRRKIVAATRKGRQYSYRMLGGKGMATPARAEATSVEAPRSTSLMIPPLALLPHKLAPGEVTILTIDASHIETATNEHGKLVLQRHPRPR